MPRAIERHSRRTAAVVPARRCPAWCVAGHGVHAGEEDWVHVGEPLVVSDGGTTARLCMSVDPATGDQDGPYILIGSIEYTPAAALALAQALMALAATAAPAAHRELP